MINNFASVRALLAQSTFSEYMLQCIQSINWFEVALTLIIGAAIAFLFFKQHSFTYTCLAWNTCLCVLLLMISRFLCFPFLSYVVYGFILLFVILYQQELRELVLKVTGVHNFIGKRSRVTVDVHRAAVDAICQAAVELARSKTGALIVVERHIKLDDIARSGVEIDAKANQYLLRNIFFNKAPLHDGAVLIRNGRIWAAGCILPLTNRTDVDQDLGTRHRAAIGISELCDAVVIVVSEETGVISVAYQSLLTRDYSFQTLHTFLSHSILHEEAEDKQENE